MTLLLLTCLLAVLPVVSMKSPIFGPEDVHRVEGSSVSIKCFYPATSVNRHTRKYWCRQTAKGSCTTLISSEAFVSPNYANRANLTNFPEDNLFVVDIAKLNQNDTGKYKCGLGANNRGLSFDVSLEVVKGPQLPAETQVYREDVGRKVIIKCPFTAENAQRRKSLCKKSGQSRCDTIIDSDGNKHENYKYRVKLTVGGTSGQIFTVTIDQLRVSDTGMYVCEAGNSKKNVDLQVLKPEPELVYGDLRSSVSFDCNLGPDMIRKPKFLCRMSTNGEACDTIINTLGQKTPGYEGRILYSISEENGFFSVFIIGLRKGDAGRYMCGASSDGMPGEGSPLQVWHLFVNEETSFPNIPSVVKGVAGGSVTVLCPYNPKESNLLKYWCRWEDSKNDCSLLMETEGLVNQQYKGRLVLYDEPANGTYTVILNQLTPQDAGFYWCMTNGDTRWRYSVELKIVEGEPNLKVPEKVVASKGEHLKLPCHFPCKFYPQEKYWCKWTNKGCQTLPSQDDGPSSAFVNCDQNSRIVSLTLNSVTKADEGWYWCGVKQGHRYGETAAVYVAVQEKTKVAQDVSQPKAVPSGDVVVQPDGRKVENKVVQDPTLDVIEDFEAPAGESKINTQPGSAEGQSSTSTVLVSTLVPLALMLVVGFAAVGVLRARHRRNVDRVSIGSYRTDISMSDLENTGDFGGNDNRGAYPVSRETSIAGKDDFPATSGCPMESEEPKKAKRSSKEEAELTYNALVIQSKNMAGNIPDGPQEA
ncbi:polymeric immunoglobulin receptor [Rhynchocyon petersi]